jgi:hypothetical protein
MLVRFSGRSPAALRTSLVPVSVKQLEILETYSAPKPFMNFPTCNTSSLLFKILSARKVFLAAKVAVSFHLNQLWHFQLSM